MMLSVEADALAQALGRAKVGRSYLAVLSGVRLVAKDGELACWRSDLTLTVECWAPASKGELDVIVPADLLAQFAQTVDGPIALGVMDGRLVAEARRGSVTLPLMPDKDWPAVAHVEADPVMLEGDDVAAIAVASYAAASDATKRALTGVFFTGTHVMTSDGFRLARAKCAIPECLVAPSAVADLEPGSVSVGERAVTFSSEHGCRTVQRMTEQFPPTDRLWTDPSEQIRVNRAALLSAVKVALLASPVGAERQRLVALTADDDGRLTIVSVGGEATSAATVDMEGHFDYRLGVNATFLAQMLNASDDDEVELGLRGAMGPLSMKGRHDSDHLLMTVRLLT